MNSIYIQLYIEVSKHCNSAELQLAYWPEPV